MWSIEYLFLFFFVIKGSQSNAVNRKKVMIIINHLFTLNTIMICAFVFKRKKNLLIGLLHLLHQKKKSNNNKFQNSFKPNLLKKHCISVILNKS